MVATVFPDANNQTVAFILSDTSETTVLTALDGFEGFQLTQLWLADDGGAARTVTVKASVAGTEITLVSSGAIAANTPLMYDLTGLVLNKTPDNTDTLKVTASAGGVHGFIGYIAVGRQS